MQRILVALIILIVGGCIPVEYDYVYMSFEKLPEAEITNRGFAEIRNLESHDQMPISYQVIRGAYKLAIDTDIKSKRPASFIRVVGIDGRPLILDGLSVGDCGGFDYLTFDGKNSGSLRYEWWGFVKEQCIRRDIAATDMKIVFRVRDGNTLLADESLPFQLIKNGVYYEYDAP